jgi:hypothetical protein
LTFLCKIKTNQKDIVVEILEASMSMEQDEESSLGKEYAIAYNHSNLMMWSSKTTNSQST